MKSLQSTTPLRFLYTYMAFKVGKGYCCWFVWKKWACKGIANNVFQLMFTTMATYVGLSIINLGRRLTTLM